MRKWETSDVIAAVSAVVAIAVFAFGIWEYRASENWKRSEFVAAQIKEFSADRINESVLLMLDYDPAAVDLFPEKQNADDRKVDVPLASLVSAINGDKGTNEIEFRVRQYFEHFLKSLARFNHFMESGAIEAKELCPDFSYPVGLMTGKLRAEKLQNSNIDIAPLAAAVKDYIHRWNDEYTAAFIKKIEEGCR